MIVPQAWLHGWSIDPIVLVAAAVGSLLYLRGWRFLLEIEAPAEVGVSPHSGDARVAGAGTWRWRAVAFLVAVFTFLLAACSPIDSYAASLFWVHMTQHLLLIVVFAPLFVLAAPALPMWYGLPISVRELLQTAARRVRREPAAGAIRFLCRPVPCFLLFVAGTWAWHLPALYDRALSNEVLHDYGEHNTFIVVALAFWLQIIPSAPFKPVLHVLGRALFIFAAVLQNVVLSMILGFAPSPLYAPYAQLAHRPGGISALADQQIGAAVMWSVGDLPFVIALMVLVQVWLRASLHEDPVVSDVEPGGTVGYTA